MVVFLGRIDIMLAPEEYKKTIPRSHACALKLYIEPKTLIKKSKYSESISVWLTSPTPIRKISEYAHLYDDGRIYYTYFPEVKGYYTAVPKLRSEKDKKSLWAILAMKLREQDIKFFFDELTQAAEIVEG
ncbi:MAG: hypothetical protein ABIG56_05785 [Candidatus Omnitrophota bacterium]